MTARDRETARTVARCENCIDLAQDAYEALIERDAAVRCCETGHRPAYRRGRIAGQRDIERASARGVRIGQRQGATRALVACLGLLVAAMWLGRKRR